MILFNTKNWFKLSQFLECIFYCCVYLKVLLRFIIPRQINNAIAFLIYYVSYFIVNMTFLKKKKFTAFCYAVNVQY